jgi:radical SAM superfamily enzyme YgiQ (UPF0313 family)
MIANDVRVDWICQTRVDTVDAELLALMKRAGCHSIDFGIESGNDEILQSMSKGITKEKARRAFRLCRQAGIRASGFFIVGMPGETETTVQDTIRFAKELDCHVASFSIPIPYQETPLGELVGDGPVPESMDDVSEPAFATVGLSKRRILELRNQAYGEFYLRPGYVVRRMLQIRSWREFKIHIRGFLAIVRAIFRRRVFWTRPLGVAHVGWDSVPTPSRPVGTESQPTQRHPETMSEDAGRVFRDDRDAPMRSSIRE